MKIQTLPRYEDKNGWWEVLPPDRVPTIATGQHRAKTVIVGAGIAGLSVARRLAELDPSADILVVEGLRVGQGASGKNSGLMLDFHSHGESTSDTILQRNRKIWETGLDQLRAWVLQGQIQCQWSEWGRLYSAAGEDGEQSLIGLEKLLDRMEIGYVHRDGDDMRSDLGTAFYHRGMRVLGSATCNPAAMMRGLRDTLPANVKVFENTKVIGLSKEAGGTILQTEQGSIFAHRVVLTTGILSKYFGIAKGRYVGVSTYASMSEQLTQEQLAQFGMRDEFAIFPASANGATIRLTQDHRLSYRNYFTHDPSGLVTEKNVSQARDTHLAAVVKRWPFLQGLAFPYSWGGTVSVTRNDGQIFGQFDDGVYALMVNDVAPMTKGACLGKLLADYMEGHDSALLADVLSAPGAKMLPPRPFLDIGVGLKFRAQAKAGASEY